VFHEIVHDIISVISLIHAFEVVLRVYFFDFIPSDVTFISLPKTDMIGSQIGQVPFLTNDRKDGITIYYKKVLCHFDFALL
jgi:hypothetical protein